MELYKDFAAEVPKPNYSMVSTLIVLSLFQIVYGVYLWKKVKKEGGLSKLNIVVSVSVFILNQISIEVVPGLLVISVVTPLYKLTSEL